MQLMLICVCVSRILIAMNLKRMNAGNSIELFTGSVYTGGIFIYILFAYKVSSRNSR